MALADDPCLTADKGVLLLSLDLLLALYWNHATLLRYLQAKVVSEEVLWDWLKSFLRDRTLRVAVRDEF